LCYIEGVEKSKDVYEYLANVYLGSSPHKKKKHAFLKPVYKNLVKLGITIVGCLIIVLTVSIFGDRPVSKGQHAIILEDSITKINYNFDQSDKELAIFELKDINLSGFKTLDFRARKSNYKDNLHLSVEFISDFAEKSQIYIEQIPTKWQDFKIDLTEFKDISDWSRISRLLFVLEKWNAQEKKGTVYIDNVCFLK
jgi:hypothetical protein